MHAHRRTHDTHHNHSNRMEVHKKMRKLQMDKLIANVLLMHISLHQLIIGFFSLSFHLFILLLLVLWILSCGTHRHTRENERERERHAIKIVLVDLDLVKRQGYVHLLQHRLNQLALVSWPFSTIIIIVSLSIRCIAGDTI